MRVAIFTDTYPPYVNGVSTSCFNLANALKARGDEVLVVAPNPKAKDNHGGEFSVACELHLFLLKV